MNQKFGTTTAIETADVELHEGDQVRIWLRTEDAGQQVRVVEGTLETIRHYPCGDLANVDVQTSRGLVTLWDDEFGTIEKI